MTTTHPEHILTMAREAVDATRDPLMIRWHDDTLGRTHAAVLGGEQQDPLHRANLDTALEVLADHVEDGSIEQGTVGRSGATWLTFLSVQVYDVAGQVTQAWIDTVDNVLDPLEDYPVLDEFRWSEYEYEEYVETVHLQAATSGLADLLLANVESTIPDEYDHDREVEDVARDYAEGRLTITDPDTLDGLAMDARQAARHLRFDAERGYRRSPARLRARAIVLETIAEHLNPEEA